jgi:hypothetical protein
MTKFTNNSWTRVLNIIVVLAPVLTLSVWERSGTALRLKVQSNRCNGCVTPGKGRGWTVMMVQNPVCKQWKVASEHSRGLVVMTQSRIPNAINGRGHPSDGGENPSMTEMATNPSKGRSPSKGGYPCKGGYPSKGGYPCKEGYATLPLAPPRRPLQLSGFYAGCLCRRAALAGPAPPRA